MNNLKKVLAFVVVFAMMFTMAVSASPFEDVADDASYAEAVTVLNALSLMIGDDEGNFNPDQSITRAEAATVIVRAKGLGDAAAGAVGPTAFTDVPADHWASGFINIATQSGIVAGYGDGTFGPSDPVTYEQMVKLIVAALGYTPKAEANGGYPTGYLVIASQKNITKGATGSAGDAAPRKTVARLVYNALDVNMMEQTVYTKGSEEFKECDPERYLLTDLGIDKYEGVITATYATGDSVKADDESITMKYYLFNGVKDTDTVKFDSFGKTNAADLLGYYVTAYAEEDSDTDDYTLLAVAPKSGKNEVVEIDYTQVDGVEAGFESVDYLINQTDKNAITLEIAAGAKFFYNGRADEDAAKDFIEKAAGDGISAPGKIKFVSNGLSSDDYNYIFVTAYGDSYVVDEVNEARQAVYDRDGNDLDIDLEDENVIYSFFNADGSAAAFEDIKVDDVLTFAKSTDGKLVAVYISRNIVEGSVSEKTSDADAYYRIDGELYRVGRDKNLNEDVTVKVGDDGKFYLNVDNRIVYKDASSSKSAGVYAYLINADKDTSLDGNRIEVKYLTEDGKWNTDKLATKVTFYKGDDDTPVDKVADVGYAGIFTAAGKLVAPQLVKISKNSAGDINRIYLPATKDDDNFSIYKSGDLSYKANTSRLGTYDINDDTIVFSVPKKGEESTDEDDYSIASVKSIFSDDKEYTVDVYDYDNYAGVLVVYGAQTAIDPTTRLFVLTSIAKTRNANDVQVDKFYGYQEGESVSVESSEDGIEYYGIDGKPCAKVDLKAGDIIIFGLDADKNIDKIQVLFKAADAKTTDYLYVDADALDDDDLTEDYFGVAVEKKAGNKLTLDLSDAMNEAGENVIPMKGSYDVYEVNVRNDNKAIVSVSNYGAISAAKSVKAGKNIDKVFVRVYDGEIIDAVVYTYELAKDYNYVIAE